MGVSALILALVLQAQDGWSSRIRTLPDGEWIDTGVELAYTGEVTAAYSPDHRYLIRYGGCTRGRGSYEDYGYANDLWVLNADNGKWDMRRAVHMYGAEKRPVNGCSRTFCYDSKRKVFWLCHGISSHGTGGSGALYRYDPEKDLFAAANPQGKHGGDTTMMVHDPVRDLLVRVDREAAHVYDPKANAWKRGADSPPGVGLYRQIACDDTGRVIVLTDGPKDWRAGQPRPKEGEKADRAMRTWAYDAGADRWTELSPGGDALEPRSNFVIVYDTRNRALLYFAAGSGDGEGDRGKPPVTAVYDPASNRWAVQSPKTSPPAALIKASAAYDANHNAMLAYVGSRIWAYRYRGGFPSGRER